MRTLIVFIQIIVFSSATSLLAQFTTPIAPADKEQYMLECEKIKQAGVKQRRDFKYKIIDGNVTSEEYNNRVVKFTEDGRLKEYLYVDEQGRKRAIVAFEYHENGLPKAEGEFHPTGELLKRTVYGYNSEGFLLEKRTVDPYGYVLRKVYLSVDESTNTITEKKYSSPQLVSEKNISMYSNLKDGRLVQQEKYDGEFVLKFKRILLYTDEVLTREEYYNPAGRKAFYLEYIYDSNKNLSKIEKVLLDGRRLKNIIYDYNENNLLTGMIEYNNKGKIISYYKYSYEK